MLKGCFKDVALPAKFKGYFEGNLKGNMIYGGRDFRDWDT